LPRNGSDTGGANLVSLAPSTRLERAVGQRPLDRGRHEDNARRDVRTGGTGRWPRRLQRRSSAPPRASMTGKRRAPPKPRVSVLDRAHWRIGPPSARALAWPLARYPCLASRCRARALHPRVHGLVRLQSLFDAWTLCHRTRPRPHPRIDVRVEEDPAHVSINGDDRCAPGCSARPGSAGARASRDRVQPGHGQHGRSRIGAAKGPCQTSGQAQLLPDPAARSVPEGGSLATFAARQRWTATCVTFL
jgi:hypothetical protein